MSQCVILNEGRTAFLREKLSFYMLLCCKSTAEKRVHFFLKDFCNLILCGYSLSLRDKIERSKAAVMPPQPIHLALPLTWYDDGT